MNKLNDLHNFIEKKTNAFSLYQKKPKKFSTINKFLIFKN